MADIVISFPGCGIPPYISNDRTKNVILRYRYFQETQNEKASAYNLRNVAGSRRGCRTDCRRQYRNDRHHRDNHYRTRYTNWNTRNNNRDSCHDRKSWQHEHARNKQHTCTDWKSICNFALADEDSFSDLSLSNGNDFNDFAQSDWLGRGKPLSAGYVPQQHRYFNFFKQQHGNSTFN
jgi:hypothetical protein